ncbi:MAG: 3'-5' exoribonuclease YhaM family protein [Deltaproteobacteria bacterium]|jgi:3'-5' exoribonuclease|nr:3'-5' exoribonuclease YhaM family protein [Deltaproteobacteria bacterium]
MTKEIFIRDLKGLAMGQTIVNPFILNRLELAKTKRCSSYLNLELGDRTGTLPAKVWEAAELAADVLEVGQVFAFECQVDAYRGQIQLKVISFEPLAPGSYDNEDFVKSAALTDSEIKLRYAKIIEQVEDEDYRELLKDIFRSPETRSFFTRPAAKLFHHAYKGGLAEHSLSVANLASNVCDHYPALLNKSLAVTGALLHDLGKCWELEPKGLSFDFSHSGRLLGHLQMGASFIEKAAKRREGFNEEKLILLEHMILAHHGQLDKGSPVTPKILEAMVLHYVDNMDAQLNMVSAFIANEVGDKPMAWTSYDRIHESFFLSTPNFEPKRGPKGALVAEAYLGPSSPAPSDVYNGTYPDAYPDSPSFEPTVDYPTPPPDSYIEQPPLVAAPPAPLSPTPVAPSNKAASVEANLSSSSDKLAKPPPTKLF